jgi:hypothetical protein
MQSINSIFEFNSNCDIDNWQIINDVVMGGRSTASLFLDENQNGVFEGYISNENNGGFSSIQLNTGKIEIGHFKNIELNIKGDGSVYQIRLKNSNKVAHSYIYNFKTNGNWEKILIPLVEMEPSFRGYALNLSNFNHSTIELIGVLKSSKINSKFKFLIKSLKLVN